MDNICWLAPEVLAQDLSGYSYQSDIYSIGIAALELVTGEAPFAGLPITEVQLINFMSRYKPGCVHYASVILSIIGTVSLVPRPCPACRRLQYFRAWGEPGNEAKEQLIIMNYAGINRNIATYMYMTRAILFIYECIHSEVTLSTDRYHTHRYLLYQSGCNHLSVLYHYLSLYATDT